MKKVLKKLFMPLILGVILIVSLTTSVNDKKAKAASQINTWVDLHHNNGNGNVSPYSVMAFLSSDPFVAENYTNGINSVAPGDTVYLTIFLKSTVDFQGAQLNYNLDQSQVSKISDVIAPDKISALKFKKECDATFYNAYSNYLDYAAPDSGAEASDIQDALNDIPKQYGRTGSQYLEGTASNIAYNAGLAGTALVDTSRLNLLWSNSTGKTKAGTYIGAKYKITLSPTATKFDLKCQAVEMTATGTVSDKAGDMGGGQDTKSLTVSVGAGAQDNTVDTDVVVADGATSDTASFTASNTTQTITLPSSCGNPVNLSFKVKGGKGQVDKASLSTQSQISNVADGSGKEVTAQLTLSNSLGVLTTLNYTAVAQDGTRQNYTLKVQRMPRLKSIQFDKVDGKNDPVFNASTSTDSSNAVKSATDLACGTDGKNGTYNLWVAGSVTQIKITATPDAPTIRINGSSYTAGTANTYNVGSAVIVECISEDGTTIAKYTFNVKRLADNTGLNSPTAPNQKGSTDASNQPNTSGGYDYTINVPYYDQSYAKISNINVTATPKSNNSTLQFSINGGQSWTSLGQPYAANVPISDGTSKGEVIFRVTDSISGEYKDYKVTVVREAGANNNVTLKQFDVNEATPTSGSFTSGDAAPLTLVYTVPFSQKKLTVNALPTDNDATIIPGAGLKKLSNTTFEIDCTQIASGGQQSYTFRVQAKSGNTSQNYTIEVHRKAGQNTVSMANMTVNGNLPNNINGGTFTTNTYNSGKSNKEIYYYNVGANMSDTTVANETSGLGISRADTISNTTIGRDKYVIYTYKLTSEDGSVVVTYELYVFAANSENGLNDLHLNDKSTSSDLLDTTGQTVYTYSPANNSASATIAWKSKEIYANFTRKSNESVVMLKDAASGKYSPYNASTITLSPGSSNTNGKLNVVEFAVYSEYDQLLQKHLPSVKVTPNTYKFDLTVLGVGAENKLKDFSFTAFDSSGSAVGNFKSPTGNGPYQVGSTFIVDTLGDATTITISFAKVESYERVWFAGNTSEPNPLNYTHNISFSGGIDRFTVSVWGEDTSATPNVYTIELHSVSTTLSNDTTIDNTIIQEVKSGKQAYNQIPNKTNEASADKVNIALGETSVDISPKLPQGSVATINLAYKAPNGSYQNANLKGGTYRLSLTPSQTGPVSYFLKVWAVAQDGTNGSEYYIEIIVPQTSSDATLVNAQIGSDICTPNSSDNLFNELPNSSTSNVLFIPKLNDPNATFTIRTTNGITYNSASNELNNLKVGDNIIFIDVTAPDGTTKQYETHIWVDEKPEPDNLEVVGQTLNPTFSQAQKTYNVTVPFADTKETIRYTLPTSQGYDPSKLKFQYSVNGGAYSIFDPTKTFDVNLNAAGVTTVTVKISQNYSPMTPVSPLGTSQVEYTINISKDGAKTTHDLLKIFQEGNEITSFAEGAGNPTVIYYPRSQGTVDLTGIEHNGVDFKLVSTTKATQLTNNKNDGYRINLPMGKSSQVDVIVSAEDGSTGTYRFILVAAETDYDVKDMIVQDTSRKDLADTSGNNIQFNPTQTSYGVFTYLTSTNKVTLKITKPQFATLVIDGQRITTNNTVYYYDVDLSNVTEPSTVQAKIQIESEAWGVYNGANADIGQSAVYTVDLTRKEPNHDATLNVLEGIVSGMSGNQITTFVPGETSNTYNIMNVGNASSITIKAIPTVSTTSINYTKKNPYIDTITLSANTTNRIVITTLAEDGVTSETYTIYVYRTNSTPKDDNNLINIEVIDSTNKYYLSQNGVGGSQTFNPNTDTYNITIPYGATAYTITPSVDTLAGSLATAYVTNLFNGAVKDKLQTTITTAMWGTTVTHKVYAISQSGQKGTEYTINIKFDKPSKDNTLLSLKADGTELLDPTDPTKTVFNLKRANSVTSIDISALVNDPTATITGDVGTLPLNVGMNTFTVTVTAQDGTQKIYVVNVDRAQPAPELVDLGVNGEQLLDTNKKATTFDPSVTEYKVVVPYDHETADIFATSTNLKDIIVGTGKYPLSVGTQTKIVTITNSEGVSNQYKLIITRLPKAASNADLDKVVINELDANKDSIRGLEDRDTVEADGSYHKFSDDFNTDKIYYGTYRVPNKTSSLDVNPTPVVSQGTADYDPATYKVLGYDKLHIGKNQIVILVTAPDGVTQKAYVIEVIRDDISFEVDEDKISIDGYTFERVADDAKKTDAEYKVNIGKKVTSEVNFADYIKQLNPEDQDVKVEVLTDTSYNPDDVIVKVASADGEYKLVTFHVESTNNHNGFNWKTLLPFLILLIIIIILLTWILISVNKDKYGKITRKADKKSDKKQEKQNK